MVIRVIRAGLRRIFWVGLTPCHIILPCSLGGGHRHLAGNPSARYGRRGGVWRPITVGWWSIHAVNSVLLNPTVSNWVYLGRNKAPPARAPCTGRVNKTPILQGDILLVQASSVLEKRVTCVGCIVCENLKMFTSTSQNSIQNELCISNNCILHFLWVIWLTLR